MQSLSNLFKDIKGSAPARNERLCGAGSNREYYRLGEGIIGCIGTQVAENQAFIYLAEHLKSRGIRVPEVYGVTADGTRYLVEDLGDTSLHNIYTINRARAWELLKTAARELVKIQLEGDKGLDYSRCCGEFNRRGVFFDFNYFKYNFLKISGIGEFDEVKLEDAFEELAESLISENDIWGFMYRDYQSRNIMVNGEELVFIDFQGGRRGPVYYDLVSLIYQASLGLSDEEREELVKVYYEALPHKPLNINGFKARVKVFALFRTLQVLGAYGFRGYIEGKKYFIDSIPGALKNLGGLLEVAPEYLKEVGARLIAKYETGREVLNVNVSSFSYRRGYVQDKSGHGGGYVFDCRALTNPGKYAKYGAKTGRDSEVKEYLEACPEVKEYYTIIYRIVRAHARRYMERGFTDLSVAFGCTGGQHRSVFCAEKIAELLRAEFGREVNVKIEHRELESKKALILAAGFGTRLKPLTDTRPKALVEVKGKALLDHVIEKLKGAGFDNIVVNAHHFKEQIVAHLAGTDVRVSEEEQILDTGGGMKQALKKFTTGKVLVHNVDILSNADLEKLYAQSEGADATLLVSERESTRYLMFDEDMRLVGWKNVKTGESWGREGKPYAYSGIQVVDARLLMNAEKEAFSIMDFYKAKHAELTIRGAVQEGLEVTDIGKIESLEICKR